MSKASETYLLRESLSSLDLKYGCDFEALSSQLRPIDWRTVM